MVLTLQAKCPPLDQLPLVNNKKPDFMSIYSSDLKIEPQGQQVEKFTNNTVKVANPNILLLKLVPGQVFF